MGQQTECKRFVLNCFEYIDIKLNYQWALMEKFTLLLTKRKPSINRAICSRLLILVQRQNHLCF